MPARKKGNKNKKKEHTPFKRTPKRFGIGQGVPPKRDLYRYVKWPKYVRLQRQKRIIYSRLKVPAVISQFTKTLDKNTAKQCFKLMDKYRPEDKQEKKARLLKRAQEQNDGNAKAEKPRNTVKYGIKHVTSLIENKKAALVLIAHDVDPIELVIWMPALCRKTGTPYAIVKGKARLGQVVNKKTATCVAFVKNGINQEDLNAFSQLKEVINDVYLNRYEDIVKATNTGGQRMGLKTRCRVAKEKKKKEAELISRGLQ
eukprot:TRINITY_DN1207_c0_g1_i1.p1 TRINITY_DN1207_c0_g1~~TRINITY_DN1207_c0_g1_i1.p1  ORF type:complete len:257 (-),score=112.16 TRINITY_DN1207_c0_g1_i1:119-889(-)